MAYVPKGKTPEIVLNSKSDLSKLNKTLANAQDELVEILLGFVRAENSDPKMKLEAAKYLMDKRVAVSDLIAKESISKILLAQKLNPQPQQQSIANNQPRAVLSMSIQRTDGVDYAELDEENNEFDLRGVGSFDKP